MSSSTSAAHAGSPVRPAPPPRTHTTASGPDATPPAGRCDVDHLTEHSRNGPTNPANAAPLVAVNRWKQKGYAIRRLPDGSWHTTRPDGSQLE
ncbi:MAG: hypothetical protein R2754_18835 [Microthrixaceae bacterium]